MACNCNDSNVNCYHITMGCVEPVVANANHYYTKSEIDEKLEDIVSSGCCITPEEVDEKISSATSGYATEQWVLDKHYISGVDLSDYALKSDIPTVPTNVSAFNNDVPYLTEHQSLSGYATEQWVLDKHYITSVDLTDYATKEDVSSYTYDKQTIDQKVASGGTFDPTQYYTTAQTDSLLADKLDASAYTPIDTSDYYNKQDIDEMLDDEATKTWVNDNYVTISELLQYINNLQEQITSIQSSISGCCGGGGSGETIYRWITMTGDNDYVCSGTTKMSKEKKQQSTDNGITWSDVSPLETRTGGIVLEENCVDCGYGACVTLSAYTQNDVIIPNAHEQESGKLTVSTTRQGNMATYSTEITAVTISDCITEIGTPNGYGVFTWSDSSINYTNLVSVIIPSSVTLIRPNSFNTKYQGICNLRTVIVRATTPPTMSNSYEYFSTDAGLTIYVPIESVEAYKTANGWRRYADIIQVNPND